MFGVGPAYTQGMRNSAPWRGLSKSEEAADGEPADGERDWNTGFTCVVSHIAGKYTTSFSGREKPRGVNSYARKENFRNDEEERDSLIELSGQ